MRVQVHAQPARRAAQRPDRPGGQHLGRRPTSARATSSPTARDLDLYEIVRHLHAAARRASAQGRRRVPLRAAGHRVPRRAAGRLHVLVARGVPGRHATSTSSRRSASPTQFQTNPNLGLFVQDEWRPRTDLTVNAGLRYDLQWLADPIETDADNVSPRAGRGVRARATAGRCCARAAASTTTASRCAPSRTRSSATASSTGWRCVLVRAGGRAGVSRTSCRRFRRAPGEHHHDRPGHRERRRRGRPASRSSGSLTPALTATVGYLHLTGRRIIMSRNVNVPTLTAAQAAALGVPNLGRPDPRFANNSQFQSIGRSRVRRADAVARATPRAARHAARVSYTLSKALDDAGNAFFSSPQDNFDVRADWGRSDNDQRHRAGASSGTDVPSAAGFELAYLFSYASAPPFNILTGADRNNDTNVNDRPAGVGRNTGRASIRDARPAAESRRFAISGRSAHRAHRRCVQPAQPRQLPDPEQHLRARARLRCHRSASRRPPATAPAAARRAMVVLTGTRVRLKPDTTSRLAVSFGRLVRSWCLVVSFGRSSLGPVEAGHYARLAVLFWPFVVGPAEVYDART